VPKNKNWLTFWHITIFYGGMKRKITETLVAWKGRKERMPLIVNGARQIGKTYSVNEFGRTEFGNVVYVNLERNVSARGIFEGDIAPARLLPLLEANTGERVVPGKTLVFLDEIQACERALTALKYFCEEMPEVHVIAAGSLLGVAVNRERYSFPVGKVAELTLQPLDFEEFLRAAGNPGLAGEIRAHFEKNEAMEEPLHALALDFYRKYLVTGGMPAVVKAFAETGSYIEAGNIQNNIYNEYVADMAKYADNATSVKIRACYNSIPAQLAKENRKFQYKIARRGGTAAIFGEAIEWLNFAGIVLKCRKITQGSAPVAVYEYPPDFKLYMGDVGMLAARSQLPAALLLAGGGGAGAFLGAFTENYVAQALATAGRPLYYWTNDNQGEVDFVLQLAEGVVPVEVKSGLNTRSRSLMIFARQYKCPFAIRVSQKNFGFENNIKSVPLYAVFCI
jgi:predicted AAA+ superfamily ATPase